MQITETPDIWVLSARRRLSIAQIKATAAELSLQIDAEIAHCGMVPGEPWIFIARDLPKDGKTLFDWRICRPVVTPLPYEGPFELIHLESIMVASAVHRRSLRTLFTQGYAPLVEAIGRSRHVFSGESREVYRRYDGPGAPYQEIEIQFGLDR